MPKTSNLVQNQLSHDRRTHYGFLEAWVSIIGNTLLGALKIILAVFTGSISLMADAFHTLSDVLTSVVVLIGFKMAKAPADQNHPFGHGRMESIATLIIAILLMVVGYEFIKTSIIRFLKPPNISGSIFVVVVMVASGVFKEWMAQFAFRLGKKIGSSTLTVDGWHHRTDAIASILVAIAIVSARFGYMRIDPIFGIAVALIIISVALTIGLSSINYLLGQAPEHDIIEQIKKSALSFPEVLGVHGIYVHSYGEHKCISLHVEVNRKINLEKAHRTASSVENRVAKDFNASCVVHVDLGSLKKRSPREIESIIDTVLNQHPEVAGYHGVEIISTETKDNIFLHIKVQKDMSVEQSHRLSHEITNQILRSLPDYSVSIHIEPV